jgi:lysophospholipase L1-like esterase
MLDTCTRIALSPLLTYQALRVRRTAQSLPEARGPRSGTFGTGPALRLAIIGDSSAAGVGVDHQSQALAGQLTDLLGVRFDVSWHLDALTGATTRSTLHRLAQAQPKPLDVIVTALGTNDVTRLIPARLWRHQHRALLDRLRDLYQPRHIYLAGFPPIDRFPLLPEPLRWTLGRHARKLESQLLADVHGRCDITYVPFDLDPDPALMALDGFHPSARLYHLWAKEMASRIISDWPSYPS